MRKNNITEPAVCKKKSLFLSSTGSYWLGMSLPVSCKCCTCGTLRGVTNSVFGWLTFFGVVVRLFVVYYEMLKARLPEVLRRYIRDDVDV